MSDAKRRLRLAEKLFKWKPHPTQRIWMLDESRIKIAACGRRWGKTEAAAVDVATWAICNQGAVQIIVSPSYDQSRLIFNAMERLLLSQSLLRRNCRITKTPYPRLEIWGSVVMARTADEDGRNLRGSSADRVIIDEAAYVRDAVVEEVIGPMLADNDGQLVMISTPFGKNHFYRAFMSGKEKNGRYRSFRFPSLDNPHISREYIEFQKSVLTPRQYAVEYQAEFMDDQASVFAWDAIQAALKIQFEEPTSNEPWIIAGVDWARYSDYSAVVVVDAGSLPHRVVAIDRFNNLPWDEQVERTTEFLRRYDVNAVLTDQTSIGDPLLELLRKRLWEKDAAISVDGLTFTNASKREVIDNLVVRLANRELRIPDDAELVRELRFFEYELTNSGGVRMNARAGHHDDLVSALGLALWLARSRVGEARFLSSGRRRADVG